MKNDANYGGSLGKKKIFLTADTLMFNFSLTFCAVN